MGYFSPQRTGDKEPPCRQRQVYAERGMLSICSPSLTFFRFKLLAQNPLCPFEPSGLCVTSAKKPPTQSLRAYVLVLINQSINLGRCGKNIFSCTACILFKILYKLLCKIFCLCIISRFISPCIAWV